YYVDLGLLATASTPNYLYAWDASKLTTGSHLLTVDFETATDSFLEIRRSVQIANSPVAISVVLDDSRSPRNVEVYATSDFGIQLITAAIDGTSLGSLTAPNRGSVFEFALPPALRASGPHTITAQGTDLDGNSASTTLTATFSNPPTLTLDAPFDGTMVN